MTNDTSLAWQPVAGWSGGTVADIALSPRFVEDGVILAATAAGLHRSADGGRNWSLSMPGIDEPAVQFVRFAPATAADAACAFAATAQGRLYRSDDAGASWRELASWAGLGAPSTLAFSPAYADDRTLFVATAHGIYRTLDDGQSWESCTFGLLDPDVLCLACAPDFVASEVLWAGTALGGLYRSRNAGRAWRDAGAGLPDAAIQCLLVSRTFGADATLYVGTEGAGLYCSTDGGATWQQHGDALAGHSVNCLAAVEHSGRPALLAGTDEGIQRSSDGGVTWSSVAGGASLALALAAAGTTVAAATYLDGVCLSADGGGSFAPANTGLCAHIPPLAVSLDAAGLALLDVDGQLVRWDGRAAHATANGQQSQTVRALAACQAAETVQLFLIDQTGLLAGTAAAFDRRDWTVHPLPVAEAESVAALQALACEGSRTSLLLSDLQSGMHLSDNGGESWRHIPVPWTGEPLLQAELWAAGDQGCGIAAATAVQNANGNYTVHVWESTDGGAAWEILASLETEVPAVLLAAAPSGDERPLFLATRHRIIKLYREPGSGELRLLQHFFAAGNRITALRPSPDYARDHTVYAAGSHGVYRSQDGGAHWHAYGAWTHPEPAISIQPRPGVAGAAGLRLVTLGGRIWQLG